MLLLTLVAGLHGASLYLRQSQPETVRAFWAANAWVMALCVGTLSAASHAAGSLLLPWVAILSDWLHQPIATDRDDLPERFEWEQLSEQPRWNQHPGRYTRFGETRELLGAIDDQFVILGSGDALTLKFDARSLPALPAGWRRDYLVFFDGWAKDRDPNTIEALEVEPLPFHGMSGYPYRDDEHFPRTPQHEAWRAQWNTRDAREWIAPLEPRATAAWAQRAWLDATSDAR
jgi:hypothetical protein